MSALDKLLETRFVNQVMAWRDLAGFTGGVNVLLTDRTVGAGKVLDALGKKWTLYLCRS